MREASVERESTVRLAPERGTGVGQGAVRADIALIALGIGVLVGSPLSPTLPPLSRGEGDERFPVDP